MFPVILSSTYSHSSPEEEVGFMLPFRNGRFFTGKNRTDSLVFVRFSINISLGLIEDTYWCGSGNVFRGLYELAPDYMLDSCCRTHDPY